MLVRAFACIVFLVALMAPNLASADCDSSDRPGTPTQVDFYPLSDTTLHVHWSSNLYVDLIVDDLTANQFNIKSSQCCASVTGGLKGQTDYDFTVATGGHNYRLTISTRSQIAREGCLSKAVVMTATTPTTAVFHTCRDYARWALIQRGKMEACLPVYERGHILTGGRWDPVGVNHLKWCFWERAQNKTLDVDESKARDQAVAECQQNHGKTGPSATMTPDQQAILKAHNDYRKLCGGGTPQLTWNPNLAAAAANWVQGCHQEVSKDNNGNVIKDSSGNPVMFLCHENDANCPGGGTNKSPYGESLSFGYPTRTGAEAAASWICERKNYDPSNPVWSGGSFVSTPTDPCPPPTNGHFTQAVWIGTKEIGCASHSCTLNGHTGTFWGCKYKDPGNINVDTSLPGITKAIAQQNLRANVSARCGAALRSVCRAPSRPRPPATRALWHGILRL